MNVFTSPSRQRPPVECGHNFLANRVALLEGDYCVSISAHKYYVTCACNDNDKLNFYCK